MNKEQVLHIRLDKKLYQQLKRYAKKNDESLVSVSARKAIKKFINEQNNMRSIEELRDVPRDDITDNEWWLLRTTHDPELIIEEQEKHEKKY